MKRVYIFFCGDLTAANIEATSTFTALSIDDVPIGASTPETGMFTTLKATSTFTAANIDDVPIGASTPDTGKFTTLEATSTFTATSGETLTGHTITTGSIDSVPIGASSHHTRKFTTLEATGIFTAPSGNMDNVAIGAGVASTGTFSSLQSTGKISTASLQMSGSVLSSIGATDIELDSGDDDIVMNGRVRLTPNDYVPCNSSSRGALLFLPRGGKYELYICRYDTKNPNNGVYEFKKLIS